MDSALVVLSGGQDSTTCLYWAKNRFGDVRAVTFSYGQRHEREIRAARRIAEIAKVPHEVMHVGNILRSTSPLVSSTPLEIYSDYATMDRTIGDRVELTFVPMRNALFLTLAANIAISYGIRQLVTGVCQSDNANYPDCRSTFVRLQEDTINESLGITDFLIHTPLMEYTKAESVEIARDIPGTLEALAYSHTCYAGDFPPCGVCHACVLRAHGFEEAKMIDPLVARARASGGKDIYVSPTR